MPNLSFDTEPRARIEALLVEDARIHPAFAMARKNAVLARVEGERGDHFGSQSAASFLSNLHEYERLRGGQRAPSREATAYATGVMTEGELSAYERARGISTIGERRHAYRSDGQKTFTVAIGGELSRPKQASSEWDLSKFRGGPAWAEAIFKGEFSALADGVPPALARLAASSEPRALTEIGRRVIALEVALNQAAKILLTGNPVNLALGLLNHELQGESFAALTLASRREVGALFIKIESACVTDESFSWLRCLVERCDPLLFEPALWHTITRMLTRLDARMPVLQLGKATETAVERADLGSAARLKAQALDEARTLRHGMRAVYAACRNREIGSDAGQLLTDLEACFTSRALNQLDLLEQNEAIQVIVAVHARGLPDLVQAKRMRALCAICEGVVLSPKAGRWLEDVIHSLCFWEGIRS